MTVGAITSVTTCWPTRGTKPQDHFLLWHLSARELGRESQRERCAFIYDIQPIRPQNENKHLGDGRLSQRDWSLLLKEDFTAALITLILQENKIPSDRENMRNQAICERLIISGNKSLLFKRRPCSVGSIKTQAGMRR